MHSEKGTFYQQTYGMEKGDIFSFTLTKKVLENK